MMMLTRLPFILRLLVLLTLTVSSSYGDDEFAEEVRKFLSRSIRVIESASDTGSVELGEPVRLEEFYDTQVHSFSKVVSCFAPGSKLLNLLRSTDDNTVLTVPLLKEPISFGPLPHYVYPFPHINQIFLSPHPLIMLHGPPRSGKSLSLKYVYRGLKGTKPLNFYIFIDLPLLFNPDKHPDTLSESFQDILDICLSNDLRGLVRNVLVLNPSKITFLFDGVDQLPQKTMLYIIEEVRKMGAKVIMTSNLDLSKDLMKSSVLRDFQSISIPPFVTDIDLRAYMTRYWYNKLQANNVLLDPILVNNYFTAFSIIMRNSPLPWTIGMLEPLADYFSDTNIEKSIPDVSVYALPSNHQRPKLSEIIQMAETMHFPKLQFYDIFFKHTNNFLQSEVMEDYGLIALNLLYTEKYFPRTKKRLIKEHDIKLKLQPLINQYFTNAIFPLLRFNDNNKPIFFIHKEFLFYFAAKHILNSLTTDTPYYEIFRDVLRLPKLQYVAEYINEVVEHVPQLNDPNSDLWMNLKLSILDAINVRRVLDNLLEYKFDNLLSKVMEVMHPEKVLSYIYSRIPKQNFQVSNLNVLGMIPSANNHLQSDVIPRREFFKTQQRSEVILKYYMEKTIRALENVGFRWSFEEIIKATALQSADKLRERLSTYSPELIENNVLTAAGFEALSKFGRKSLEILHTLVEYGAEFSEATDYVGRTLAHVAVEWADPELLRVIHQDFMKVPLIDKPDQMGRTILFTALDSSPFAMSTPDGFWPMINYIVQHADLKANFQTVKTFLTSMTDPFPFNAENLPLQYRIMFTGEFPTYVPHTNLIFQSVPLKDWDIPLSLLSGRRNTIIKDSLTYVSFNRATLSLDDHVTLSEIIIKHRSIDQLSRTSLLAYENAILKIIQEEIPKMNWRQIERIFNGIVKNIQTHSEFIRMRNIYTNLINSIIPNSVRSKCLNIVNFLFLSRGTGEIVHNPMKNEGLYPIKTVALPTSMDLNLRLVIDDFERELSGYPSTSSGEPLEINDNNQIVHNDGIEPNNNNQNVLPNNDAMEASCSKFF